MGKEGKKLDTLNMQSPAEEVLAALINDHFGIRQTGKHLRTWKKQGETRDSLLEFLNGPIVKAKFNRQWIFETKPEWKDRQFPVALWEATGHTLSAISGDAFLWLERNMAEKFPGYTKEQVERIERQSRLLVDYFRHIEA